MIFLFFFFFFSSRRRHTRLVSDWSSDVCSSDLLRDGAIDLAVGSATSWALQVKELNLFALPWLIPDADALAALLRSDVAGTLEERVRAAGVEPLAWAAGGFRELATRREVHTPADLAGL